MTNPDWLDRESRALAHGEKPDWEAIANRAHNAWLDAQRKAWKAEDEAERYRDMLVCALVACTVVFGLVLSQAVTR